MPKRAIVILIILLGIGALFILRKDVPAPQTPQTQNSLIRVTSPLPNTLVSSPLVITGEARGNWYFEASFPVRILGADGMVLGEHYAEAQGEWMTTEFVPFRAILAFATSTTETGTLVLEKDNPSGLPENAAELRIPVRFASTSVGTSTRNIKLYQYDESRDEDAVGNVLCSAKGLVAVEKSIPFTNTPIQDAIRGFLRQEPTLSGVTLTGASLNNGLLTLTFSDPQNKTGGGSCRVSILRAQIEATAKQFGGVTSVRFMPAGVFQP